MFNLNVHIYPSNLKNESRLFKEADTLISNKLVKKVVAVGIKDSNTEKLEIRSDNIEIHRIQVWEFFKSTSLNFFLKYFFFQFFVLLKLSRSNIDVINAHNLSVLPVSVLLKIFKKSKLVYDPHELETEVHNSRGLKRKYGKWIERKLITFADEIMVVNESIKNWYENEYDISNIYVVRNVPNIELKKSAKAQNKFREVFNISEEKIIFLYQGLISSARGIDVILNAFKEVNDDKVLVLMGFGPDVDRIKKDFVNNENIFFHDAVSKKVLGTYTMSADVGFSLIENSCLNHYYCLPNKAFEYYFSKIPQITSNFPELNKLVCENSFGWCIEPNSDSLSNLLNKINKKDVEAIKNNLRNSKKFYSWEEEEKQIIMLYRDLIND
ncbi:MAG TPA: hypothetical protein DCL80_04315 [Balneola sp.]|nr:hypothetical protein [Balneola sp.]MAO77138.1 hypothetical protein [Balneola sp.]MBF63413.1 hypothetical protein [Balneola sp.]HAH50519.1 hypothetical protein [Balneola sp.]HAW80171.1 hypothetical protein [Balneola sp.]